MYKIPVTDLSQADGSSVDKCSLSTNQAYVRVNQASGNTFELPWDQVLHLADPGYLYVHGRDEDAKTDAAMRIGQRIRDYRSKAGISQVALASRAGFKPANLSRLESGKHVPSLETLERIASALRVPVVELIAE